MAPCENASRQITVKIILGERKNLLIMHLTFNAEGIDPQIGEELASEQTESSPSREHTMLAIRQSVRESRLLGLHNKEFICGFNFNIH